jgi:hypothetical protein
MLERKNGEGDYNGASSDLILDCDYVLNMYIRPVFCSDRGYLPRLLTPGWFSRVDLQNDIHE